MSARPHTRPLVVNRPPRSRDRSPRWLAAALALVLTLTLVPAAGAIAAELPDNFQFDKTIETVRFSAESGVSAIALTENWSDSEADPGKLAANTSGSGQSLAIAGIRVAILIPMGTLVLLILGAVTLMVVRRRVDREEHTL